MRKTQKVERSTKQSELVTNVQRVKVSEEAVEPNPLRKGDTFLFIKDGREVYMTRSVANVLLLKGASNVEIPKGSEYVPPKNAKCSNCG